MNEWTLRRGRNAVVCGEKWNHKYLKLNFNVVCGVYSILNASQKENHSMQLENYMLKQWQSISMQTSAVMVSDAGEDVEQQECSCIARGREIVHSPQKTTSENGIFVTGFSICLLRYPCAHSLHMNKITLFINAKTRNWPRYRWINEWLLVHSDNGIWLAT